MRSPDRCTLARFLTGCEFPGDPGEPVRVRDRLEHIADAVLDLKIDLDNAREESLGHAEALTRIDLALDDYFPVPALADAESRVTEAVRQLAEVRDLLDRGCHPGDPGKWYALGERIEAILRAERRAA